MSSIQAFAKWQKVTNANRLTVVSLSWNVGLSFPWAIIVPAGCLDPLEQFIDFLAGFFVFTFFDLFGKLVELLD